MLTAKLTAVAIVEACTSAHTDMHFHFLPHGFRNVSFKQRGTSAMATSVTNLFPLVVFISLFAH